MWFGTQDGLNRFDGRNFIAFKNDPYNAASISGNVINDLVEDSSGIIWIGTADAGLCSYYYRSKLFPSYSYEIGVFELNFTPYVLSVAVDAAQLIWVGAEKVGLFCLNALTDSFTYFVASNGTPAGCVQR